MLAYATVIPATPMQRQELEDSLGYTVSSRPASTTVKQLFSLNWSTPSQGVEEAHTIQEVKETYKAQETPEVTRFTKTLPRLCKQKQWLGRRDSPIDPEITDVMRGALETQCWWFIICAGLGFSVTKLCGVPHTSVRNANKPTDSLN